MKSENKRTVVRIEKVISASQDETRIRIFEDLDGDGTMEIILRGHHPDLDDIVIVRPVSGTDPTRRWELIEE